MPIKFTLNDPPAALPMAIAPLPLTFAAEMPHFEGNLERYLKKEIRCPQEAQRAKERGNASVTFVVEKDGRVTGAKIAQGKSAALDAEALRVINAMPLWVPGRQGGQPVAVYQSVTGPF